MYKYYIIGPRTFLAISEAKAVKVINCYERSTIVLTHGNRVQWIDIPDKAKPITEELFMSEYEIAKSRLL
jgi:hypothetical protein